MRSPEDFLSEHPEPRPWELPDGGRDGVFTPVHLFLGRGDFALEVAVVSASSRPNVSDVRQLWKRRRANRAAPVILVVLFPQNSSLAASVCGPVGEDPPVVSDRDPGQIERIASAALAEPDRQAAIRFLTEVLAAEDTELPGIRNAGMFSTHALTRELREHEDWPVMATWGSRMLPVRGRQLVEGLGFDVDAFGSSTSVLRIRQTKTRAAVAVFLDDQETPDGSYERFGGSTAVSHALAVADQEQLPFVVVTRGSQIRVYAATRHTGVGRKGRAETFIEANLTLLPEDLAGALPLLFGAPALAPGGSFEELLELSKRYATGLGERLRARVYEEVVPKLAEIVAEDHHGTTDTVADSDLDDLYEAAMVILFRMLFVAYAEDKDLLPYRSNGLYQRNALKSLAQDLAERANEDKLDFDSTATALWAQLKSLWRAVAQGNRDWDIPPYNGGMFSSDPTVSTVGARIDALEVTNADIGPAVFALLVDQSVEGVYGPVDFRSLSVREFGTIYEGLLESSLAVADTDLTTDKDGQYLPASGDQEVVVAAGRIYLHNRSGARKATGSFFTKPFAVEHLLDHALDPAIDDHLARIEALLEADDDAGAADAFFDFRVADIAMGSGHFLVAAVDHIEARFSTFLARNQIPRVVADLQELRRTALSNLGEVAGAYEIEDSSLLRRFIARRCIYGIDLNLIAVELARLGIWIHTFVPGLPLSFLDHNLVQGNSLTGIATLDEALDILAPDQGKSGTPSMLRGLLEEWLGRAADDLRRLGRLSDATTTDIKEARQAHQDALAKIEPVQQLFDLLIAVRLGEASRIEDLSDETLAGHPDLDEASDIATVLGALHFPVAFPEVFLRDRPGFDCLLGNPPWEKAMAETSTFWSLRFPGLRSLSVGDQNRRVEALEQSRPDLAAEFARLREQKDRVRAALLAGSFPGLGRGHPDLYQAFAWRYWQVLATDGAVGVVLPRSALSGSGSAQWRDEILDHGGFSDIVFMTNTGNWAFDDMEPRYTIALVSIRRGDRHAGEIHLRGPYASLVAYQRGVQSLRTTFRVDDFRTWTEGAAFPLLPSDTSGDVFLKLRAHPRFDSDEHPWAARPVQGDLNATAEKPQMILDPDSTDGLWPVYKGASFNLWQPDTGTYYAWVDPDHITMYLHEKRLRQASHKRSAFSLMAADWTKDPESLPCLHPRIAFRDIARATDTRTTIAALIPSGRTINHTAPYLLFSRGDEFDVAFLLGVLSSIPLDWYSRRVVELHMTFQLLQALPIPVRGRNSRLGQRVVEVTGRLAAVDDRYRAWASAVGVSAASVDEVEREDLISELDALVARLYGLDSDDVTHIFQTFHEGWAYQERLERVLDWMERLET